MKKCLFFFLLFLLVIPASRLQARLVPQRSVLDNGLVLLSSEQRDLPMITFRILIDAGSRHDPEGRGGLARLTARLLTRGTRERTSLQISEILDFIGASLHTGGGREVASVQLTVLKKDLDTGLKLLTEILTESTFPPEEIERQRQSTLASIQAKKEDPGEIAEMKFLEALFPQSPYGRPTEGTERSVRAIERRNLVGFYKRLYRPNRAILAAVGDISHGELVEKLRQAFQVWERGAPIENPSFSDSTGPADVIRIHKKLTQANIIIGHEGVPRNHPDYYAIRVMNYILGGGGFSSRLMDSIRNERGLAYSVYSTFDADKYTGTFRVVMQTKNETANEAIRIAVEEIRRIRERGVSTEELQAAKNYLIGSFPLRFDTNSRIAGLLAQVEFFGLGLDYVERYPELIRPVSREDVLRVAKRHLRPENLITVIVADQKQTNSQR